MELLYEYSVLSLVPVWFISYAVIRMKRHWSDGKDKFILLNRHVYLKWLLTLIMTLLTFFHILDLSFFATLTQSQMISRSAFFGLLFCAWLVSFKLAIFENNKRLVMKWTGHRSFWPVNLGIHVYLFINEEIFFDVHSLIANWTAVILATYALQAACCLVLTLYAFFRPNEFLTIGECDYSLMRKDFRKSSAIMNTGEQLEYPLISIKSYKIKQECSKSITIFTIISTINSQIFISKRSLADFDSLQKEIKTKFPQEIFPNLTIPSFSSILAYTAEDKMKVFVEYLNNLSAPEFMLPEFLDFLRITDPCRANLIKANEEILQKDATLSVGELRSESTIERYFNTSTKSEIAENLDEQSGYLYQKYIEVKISKWIEVEKHIEYSIIWAIRYMELSGGTQKRYNDFQEFHKHHNKIVTPARLPKFPSKNYIKKLTKIDEKALNLRRVKLEDYLSHILNDPAFLCREALEFVGINTTVESILSFKHPASQIKLQSPLSCYPEIDDRGYHLVYSIKLCKSVEGSQKIGWCVTRRFREFDELHCFLQNRAQSALLSKGSHKCTVISMPNLPGKSVGQMVCPADIESRRHGLEKYLEDLLLVPKISQAYVLHKFLQEPESHSGILIN